ncbi:hypothetical protein CYY_008082 [Polysphondylium violaceum]|uniref:Uncharacterized protein n=1 Tax=Polysphondylium violaceum TaxID=133409 RepID=A0A8J4UQF3_9MYCE|nr:hypothetical protein CYY_008082 [Polysphondylium violaceum]
MGSDSVEDLLLLNTHCIRKTHIPNEQVIDHLGGTVREHFVELQVIIKVHYNDYKDKTFKDGIQKLLELRNKFNGPGNVFHTTAEINELKKKITEIYLQNNYLYVGLDKVRSEITLQYSNSMFWLQFANKKLFLNINLFEELSFYIKCATKHPWFKTLNSDHYFKHYIDFVSFISDLEPIEV